MVVVSYYERKLAKHVKRVREKTKSGKERIFHSLSPSITRTLAFQPYITLSPITRSTRNEKYKGARRRTTNLNYPTLQHGEENPKTILKTTQKLLSPRLWKAPSIYRQNWTTWYRYGAARQILARGSTPELRKRGPGCVFTAGGARCTLIPLSAAYSGFWFWAPGFDETALQSQWLYYRPLITH